MPKNRRSRAGKKRRPSYRLKGKGTKPKKPKKPKKPGHPVFPPQEPEVSVQSRPIVLSDWADMGMGTFRHGTGIR